jgi:putative membrane protein
MIRIVQIILFVLVFVFGLAFAAINADPVPLNYYFGSQELPLSLLIVVVLFCGACLGLAATISVLLRSKRKAAQLGRKLKVAEREIAALRSLPTRDDH